LLRDGRRLSSMQRGFPSAQSLVDELPDLIRGVLRKDGEEAVLPGQLLGEEGGRRSRELGLRLVELPNGERDVRRRELVVVWHRMESLAEGVCPRRLIRSVWSVGFKTTQPSSFGRRTPKAEKSRSPSRFGESKS